jgi:hypothetical protein
LSIEYGVDTTWKLILALAVCLLATAVLLLTPSACSNQPSDQPSDQNDKPSVDYYRSGGFAGLTDRLIIDNNGHCTLQRKNGRFEFNLPAADFQHLRELFQQADFFNLAGEYLPEKSGADLFTYIITYRSSGSEHTVRTIDGTVPAALMPVIIQLNSIVSNNTE